MMVSLAGEYQLKSNRESGYGRYDVMLIPRQGTRKGVIIEFKKADEDEALETACEKALLQIRKKDYRSELEAAGVSSIVEVGIAFQGKAVRVMGVSS